MQKLKEFFTGKEMQTKTRLRKTPFKRKENYTRRKSRSTQRDDEHEEGS